MPPLAVPEDLHRAIEDLNAEIGVYLGIIYFVIEVFRNDETFGDELSMLFAGGKMGVWLRLGVFFFRLFQWQWRSRYRCICSDWLPVSGTSRTRDFP